MLKKGHGDLYKASTKEESERLRGERGQIKFIHLRFGLGRALLHKILL